MGLEQFKNRNVGTQNYKMLDLGDEKLNENKFQKVVHEDKEGSIEFIYDFEDFIEIIKNIAKSLPINFKLYIIHVNYYLFNIKN